MKKHNILENVVLFDNLGDENEIQQLLNNTIDLNARNNDGNMTLIDAALIRCAALITGEY